MSPRKRTRRTRGNREVGPVQLELDLDMGPEPAAELRPRRRVTGPAVHYTEAAGSQTATPDTTEESTDVAGE